MAERKYMPSEIRRKVWERAGGCCELCGKRLTRFRSQLRLMEDDELGHIDHLRPVSMGGRHTLANLRLICETTNLSRGDGTQHAYRNCEERYA